jgi:hypothetical protein
MRKAAYEFSKSVTLDWDCSGGRRGERMQFDSIVTGSSDIRAEYVEL